MRWRRTRARPVVVFLDQDGWNCFLQLAAALRRAGARPVCVQIEGGRRRALMGRVGYGTVLNARCERHIRRLQRLVDGHRIVDIHVNELNFARLDRMSSCAIVLHRALGPGSGGRWRLLDKLEVSEQLAAGGVPVPPFFRFESTGADAVSELEFPLIVKQRISSGGAGVLVADDRAALTRALSELTARAGAGSPDPPVFAERYLPGDIVQYAALAGPERIELEACLLVRKGADDPFGPSVGIETIDAPGLRETGRKAVGILGCRGLVNLEFIRDPDGRLWHIDLSARAYGNIAALTDAGVDMIAGYLALLGLAEPAPPAAGRCTPGKSLQVFPTSLLERKHRLGLRHALHALVPEARPYLGAFGARYLLAISLVVVDARLRAVLRRRRAMVGRGRPAGGESTSLKRRRPWHL